MQNKPLKSYVLQQHHATNPYRSEHTQTTLVSFMLTALIMVTDGGVPKNSVWGGQQIQLRTEDRENGDLGAVAP